MKKKINLELQNAIKEFDKAQEDLNCARNIFNNVNDKFFEIANTDLTIAQMKVNNILKKIKLLDYDYDLTQ